MNDISSGNYKIISTGSLMSFEDNPIRVSFGEITDQMFITFSFHGTENSNDECRVDIVSVSSKELELKLFNFNNPLGVGNTNPMSIGSSNSKKLFLNYRIYTLNGVSSRLVHYTIYQEI